MRKNGVSPSRDLIGSIFGRWTVVGFAGRSKHNGLMWLCKCECGFESEVRASSLRNKSSQGCKKCSASGNFATDSLVGKTFGRWTVVSQVPHVRHTSRRWVAECENGHQHVFLTNTLTSHAPKKCKGCTEKLAGNKIPMQFWNALVWASSKRGREIDISPRYALDLLEKQDFKCALTGQDIVMANSEKERIAGKTTASLDRIDSSKGYIKGNIQWVHKDVNRMKSIFSQERFIEVCRMVAQTHCHDFLGGHIDSDSEHAA